MTARPHLLKRWPAPVAQVRQPQAIRPTVPLRTAIVNTRYFERQIRRLWPNRDRVPSGRRLLRHYVRCYRQWCELI